MDPIVERGTDSYIDDIAVDESVVLADKVVAHLKAYGLEAKSPAEFSGARVLGLRLSSDEEDCLVFDRGNEIPELPSDGHLTRRQVFSICGKLVGHYPIAGWLRVACSYLKRCCEGTLWEDYIGERAEDMAKELLSRVRVADPVHGIWHVPAVSSGRVWCDASSLAVGVALEMDGRLIEDAAWLRKASDCAHINVSELDAVLKGINLALKWDLTEIEVMTDSVTVLHWLNSALSKDRRIKTRGSAEMLIKRRLATFQELVSTFNLSVSVTYVRSEMNRADALTRVKKSWLRCGEAVEETT